MPSLLRLVDVSIGFRGPALLDNISCQIETRQRIGLLGRNGAGKSTLMRLLVGEQLADHGQIILTPGTRVAMLPQDVPRDLAGPIYDVVLGALTKHDPDSHNDWEHQKKVDRLLLQMGLEPDREVASLSSGMKRRVLLAQALVTNPDILLLDEPTNHLDIDAIKWLEDFLLRWPGTLLFVTHDRMFLRRLATRIWEVDRGRLFDWSCNYETFLVRKEDVLAAEEKQAALFDKRLAQEEAWLRQGVKARRTRNEGRVRALHAMRNERSQRRDKVGTAKLNIQVAERSGALVAEVEDLGFAYDARPIVSELSTTIMRGDKIGIIGPNGAGKTTLLKLLLGQLSPQQGKVRMGTNQSIAYFDQLRDTLDSEKTVQDNLGAGGESITINGVSRHVLGYLQDFLFPPDRARTPVKFLSGGERNRLLLARLFSKPANILVLDEPTNDLDSETLELLEDLLVEFPGTVLLVSHDREFLNNVVSSSLVFEDGNVREYVGGYDDYQRQKAAPVEASPAKSMTPAKGGAATATVPQAPARKLNYKEKHELEKLPGTIEKLEKDVAALLATMSAPEFYKKPPKELAAAQAKMDKLNGDLATAYKRWELLEPNAE